MDQFIEARSESDNFIQIKGWAQEAVIWVAHGKMKADSIAMIVCGISNFSSFFVTCSRNISVPGISPVEHTSNISDSRRNP